MTGRGRHDERGQVTVFALLLTTVTLLFAGLVLDGGRGLAAHLRALSQAQQAARAGAQAVNLSAYRTSGTLRLDPARARHLAAAYLDAVHAHGTVTATPSRVSVTVTRRQPTALLRLIGLPTLTTGATGTATPVLATSPEANP